MDMNLVVAKNLLHLRNARGLNQTAAGAIIGVSQQTWARYEKGEVEITVNLLAEIAEKFNVQIEAFLRVSEFDAKSTLPKVSSKRDAKKEPARG